jgi:hypothetical protein
MKQQPLRDKLACISAEKVPLRNAAAVLGDTLSFERASCSGCECVVQHRQRSRETDSGQNNTIIHC